MFKPTSEKGFVFVASSVVFLGHKIDADGQDQSDRGGSFRIKIFVDATYVCPTLAPVLINTYRNNSWLFVDGRERELYRNTYAIGTQPWIKSRKTQEVVGRIENTELLAQCSKAQILAFCLEGKQYLGGAINQNG